MMVSYSNVLLFYLLFGFIFLLADYCFKSIVVLFVFFNCLGYNLRVIIITEGCVINIGNE